MTGLEQSVIMLVAVWLLLLTVVAVLLTKQVVLITGRMTQVTNVASGASMIGMTVPERIDSGLRERMDGTESYAVVILSLTCTPCRVVASDTHNWPGRMPVAAILDGTDQSIFDELRQLLSKHVHVVPFAETSTVAAAFPTSVRPFGIIIDQGAVVYAEPISVPRRFVERWDEMREAGDTRGDYSNSTGAEGRDIVTVRWRGD